MTVCVVRCVAGMSAIYLYSIGEDFCTATDSPVDLASLRVSVILVGIDVMTYFREHRDLGVQIKDEPVSQQKNSV